MPELPEITVIGRQMQRALTGRKIASIDVRQPKTLNLSPSLFKKRIVGRTIEEVRPKGKWLFLDLTGGENLLLNLGMGGDLVYFDAGAELPDKYQFKLDFDDGSGFTIRFYWFGYIHLANDRELSNHGMTGSLGVSPLDRGFTRKALGELLDEKKRSRVKSFLMDQKNIAGIGNVYLQDILFGARLHPNRTIESMTEKERDALYDSMRNVLKASIAKGGLAYEVDFMGKKGRYSVDDMAVGYKEGKQCPVCKTKIAKIRTGSTSTYICPKCQRGRG
jgi:formamidopyrimidine-DNA glycosylase